MPTEWTRYAFRIAEQPLPGARRQDRFWPGAAYLRIKILHQYTHRPKPLPADERPPELLFDDIVLKEVMPNKASK